MKSKGAVLGLSIAIVLQVRILACSAQTNIYLFSGSKTNITLAAGTYIITAYGAPGGTGLWGGGAGDEVMAEFNFSTSTTLTLLVGGGGGTGGERNCSGGGGGSFVVKGSTPLVIAGGGGGCGEYALQGNGGDGGTNGSAGGFNGYGAGGDGPGGTGGGGGGGGIAFGGGLSGGGGGGGFLGNGTNGGGGGVGVHTFGGAGGDSFESGGGAPIGHGMPYDPPSGGGFGGGGGGGTGGIDGGGGGGGGYSGGGGGGDENGLHMAGGGGGGGSIIDSSAIAILFPTIYTLSPDDPYNGEIIITAVQVAITTGAAFGFTNGVFGFNVIGPSGSNVVIQASADLQTWIPLQTNMLGSGPLHFSDAQSTTNVQRFYRLRSP